MDTHLLTRHKKSVLIVEDNELNMRLFCDLLEASGYQTYKCMNGKEAVDLVREIEPELIIMDIQLPEISGLDITRAIKCDPYIAHIPVLAVTAFALHTDEAFILEAGCAGCISKPIEIKSFVKRVDALIGRKIPA